jgi:hypothetical protein
LDGLDLNEMFGAALGLDEPWRVTSVEFDQEAGRLDLRLDFPRGARFRCPEPGCAEAAGAAHDPAEKTCQVHPDQPSIGPGRPSIVFTDHVLLLLL